jgi:hypothetical protein
MAFMLTMSPKPRQREGCAPWQERCGSLWSKWWCYLHHFPSERPNDPERPSCNVIAVRRAELSGPPTSCCEV